MTKTLPTNDELTRHIRSIGSSSFGPENRYLEAVLDGNITPRDWDPEALAMWRKRSSEMRAAKAKALASVNDILPTVNARLKSAAVGWRHGFRAAPHVTFDEDTGSVVPYVIISGTSGVFTRIDLSYILNFSDEERADAILYALHKTLLRWANDIQRARGAARTWEKAYQKAESDTLKRQRDERIQMARETEGVVVLGPWQAASGEDSDATEDVAEEDVDPTEDY